MSYIKANKMSGDYPWNEQDPRKLGGVISEFVEKYDSYLAPWSQMWFENFNFIHGNHDVIWSKKWGFAVDVDFLSRRTPSMNMRSKTNVSRTVFESLSSLIFSSAPDWDVMAADESSTQGRRFQKIIDSVLDCYYERLCMDRELRSFTNNLVTYGLSAAKIDWCVSSGQMVTSEVMEEQDVTLFTEYPQSTTMGVVDAIIQGENPEGMPAVERRLVPKRDENGQIVKEHRWSGDVRITTLTPFEYRRELNPHGTHKSKWFQHIRIMDYDDFLREYASFGDRTAYFERIQPGMMHSSAYKFAIRQYMRMHFVTPMAPRDVRRLTFSSLKQDFMKNKVIVVEHYDRPDPDLWPEGRVTVVVNGYVTNISKPQYSTRKVNGWHPFVEASWITLSPSSIPSGPMNDITAKNRELDMLDSLIDTSSMRNLGSMMLVKAGSGLDPQRIWAEPGLIQEVNDLNCITYARDPLPIPPIAAQLREMKKEDIYEISGSQDAIRGDRSKGVSSGYGQKIVEEREQRRLTPVRRELERATGEMGQKLIACLKACAPTLDDMTFGFLKRSAAGQFSNKDIIAFMKTPIDYGVDVNVRGGSMVAKSQAAEQQDIMDMIKTVPMAQQRLQDASVLDNVLKKFGIEALRDGSAVHRDKALRENEVFTDLGTLGPDATGIQIPVVCPEDDHQIHITSHDLDLVEKFDDIQHDEFQLFLRTFHRECHKMYQLEQTGQVPQGSAFQFNKFYQQANSMPTRDMGQLVALKQQADQQKLQTQAQAAQAPGGAANADAAQSQGGKQAETTNKQAESQVGREMGA